MKYSLAGSILTLATVALQATAAVMGGKKPSSSSYYADHTYTKYVTTTCWHTTTKTAECSYGGGYPTDYPKNYDTVDPQVYKDYHTIYETVYESGYPYPNDYSHDYPYDKQKTVTVTGNGVYHTVPEGVTVSESFYHTVTGNGIYHTITGNGIYHTVTGNGVYHTVTGPISTVTVESSFYETSTVTVESSFYETSTVTVESSFYETSTVTVESSFYSTISNTVTSTVQGGCQCTDSPWVRDPGFDTQFPGIWFPYANHFGTVSQVATGDPSHGNAVELNVGHSGGQGDQSTGNGNEPQLLEQAVVVPGGRSFSIKFDARRTLEITKSILFLKFWLGPNMFAQQEFDAPSSSWGSYSLPLSGTVLGTLECVPTILRIEVSVSSAQGSQPNPGQEKAIQIDNVQLV